MPETAAKLQLQSHTVQQIDVDRLAPSPFNARKHFDRPALAELAASIKAEGILQPLIVRQQPAAAKGNYEIIAGERRFRAAELAELKLVPCIVLDVNEVEARRLQIIENLQREGITPLEEAQSFQDLLKAKGDAGVNVTVGTTAPDGKGGHKLADGGPSHTVEAIAKELGKSKEYVYGRLKLLKLGKAARKALEQGHISAGHAVELVPLTEAQQEKALNILEAERVDGGMTDYSVMQLRDEIKYSIAPPPKPKPSKSEKAQRDRFQAQQKRDRDAHEKQMKAQREASELAKRVDAKAYPSLWARLKAADAKSREHMIDNAIRNALDEGQLVDAMLISEGKPRSEGYVSFAPFLKRFDKMPRPQRLAIATLAMVLENQGWHEKQNEPVWKWAKIDRDKIRRELLAADKAVEKKAAATIGKAVVDAVKKHGVSTSAKPAAKAKGKTKSKAKAAGKAGRAKTKRK